MSLKRILLKAIALLLLFNLLFAALKPIPWLEKISGYNLIFPGRERLPFGENPVEAYNFSLFQVDAMLRSHIIASPHVPKGEYRVVVIGDSSVWGYLLTPEHTLTAYLNRLGLSDSSGKKLHFYNLGYPTLSLTKDLFILDKVMHYQPDMVIWLVTLESFLRVNQLAAPIVQHNPEDILAISRKLHLGIDPEDPSFVKDSFLLNTLVGQRRALADLIRLQLYGVMWAATGVDQYYPPKVNPPQVDLAADETMQDYEPPLLKPDNLALDILHAGLEEVGGKPFILVNEPIFISPGKNSNIRYNFFYPRWAYDQYRELLIKDCRDNGWTCLDVWDLISYKEFTNSAIHLTPQGTSELANVIGEMVQNQLEK